VSVSIIWDVRAVKDKQVGAMKLCAFAESAVVFQGIRGHQSVTLFVVGGDAVNKKMNNV
jgi:hypothetical protein